MLHKKLLFQLLKKPLHITRTIQWQWQEMCVEYMQHHQTLIMRVRRDPWNHLHKQQLMDSGFKAWSEAESISNTAFSLQNSTVRMQCWTMTLEPSSVYSPLWAGRGLELDEL